jgi:hypothetical protein
MALILRIFAECGSGERAAEVGRDLAAALAAFRPVASMEPARYRKLPELFEFSFDLSPGTRATFDAVLARAADGWVHTGDEEHGSSVWNRPPGGMLLSPAVRWAELIRFDEDRREP